MLEKLDCNLYRITNSALVQRTAVVAKLQDDGTFEETGSFNVSGSDSVDFTIDADGVYQVTLGVDAYVAFVYCTIKEGFLTMLSTVLTDIAPCEKKQANYVYYFNAVNLAFYGLLMQLNGEYVNNWIFDAMDEVQLEVLKCINETISRISEYMVCMGIIDDCGCGCK